MADFRLQIGICNLQSKICNRHLPGLLGWLLEQRLRCVVGAAKGGGGQLGPSIQTESATSEVEHLMNHVGNFAFPLHARAKAGVVEPPAADSPDAAKDLVSLFGEMLGQPF